MLTSFGSLEPGSLRPQLDTAFTRLADANFVEALWHRRPSLWSSDAAIQSAVANRLGWLVAADTIRPLLDEVRSVATDVRTAGFTDVVLLGMGGSSLAPEVIRQVVGVAQGWPRFRMLDSIDPDAVRRAMSNAESSLFVVASKSGTTIEPTAMAAEARRLVEAAGHPWGSRFIAVTDAGTALEEQARACNFRHVFVNPSDIGGRYSALSLFGLVPAALMGLDPESLLVRGAAMADACRIPDPRQNPGLVLGATLAAAASAGRDKLTLLLPDVLSGLGIWIEQLVAESTGKNGQGVVPITGESHLPTYGNDRLVVSVSLADASPDPAHLHALRSAGSPAIAWTLPDALALGAEFMRWEVATAVAGWLLEVNPFSEPDVRHAKETTGALIVRYSQEGHLPTPTVHARAGDALLTLSEAARRESPEPNAFLSMIRPGDYVSILAYLPPDDTMSAGVLDRFRTAIGHRDGVATMYGIGPRYLHSTGQLHKGGPATGVFLIISLQPDDDLQVPGLPYSFGVLETAQALGDFSVLDQLGRRCLLIRLPGDGSATLETLLDRLLAEPSSSS